MPRARIGALGTAPDFWDRSLAVRALRGAAVALFALSSAAGALEFSASELRQIAQHSPLPAPPADPTNAFADDAAAALLGQELFFDERLSAAGDVSCASCHVPSRGFSNGARLGIGASGATTARHVPTLLNTAYNRWYFWDGRADSAWSQATQPLEGPTEHAGNRLQIVRTASRIPPIRADYERVFGDWPDFDDARRFPERASPRPYDAANVRAWNAMAPADRHAVDRVFTNLAKALAAYQRQLVSRDSAFDHFAAQLASGSDADAIPESAQRGLRLFLGRGNCRLCHSGPNFSDGEFHDTALPRSGGLRDTGRFGGIRRLLADPFNSSGEFSDGVRPELRFVFARRDSSGEFKTPTLRDVARTAPYTHTGQFATLRELLRFYSTRENVPRTHGESGVIRRLDLSEAELDDLEAFLRTLDGAPLPEHLLVAPGSDQTIVPSPRPQ